MLRGRTGGKDTLVKWLIHILSSIVLRLFFRRIEVINSEFVPRFGGVIFVLNHPSGLVDPALVFCVLPRHATFLAKATLFEVPIVRVIVKAWEALPVHRRVDTGGIVVAGDNDETFEQCFAILQRGEAIALFPEGVSHDSPHLLPLKTGAARIALGAAAKHETRLRIVPVSIYYTSKTRFRSEALVRFGEAFEVESGLPLDAGGKPSRAAVLALHEHIGNALYAITLNVEDNDSLEDVRKAERLFSSIYETIGIRESLARQFERLRYFAEKWQSDGMSPNLRDDLQGRIAQYEDGLITLGLRPNHLSIASHSRSYMFRQVVVKTAVLTLLSPLAAIGFVIHYPAYQLSGYLGRKYAKHGIDDILPTARILAASMLVSTSWTILFALCWWLSDFRVAFAMLAGVMLSGYIVMRFREELQDLRGWFRASLLFLRNRRLFLKLLLERRKLHENLSELV